MYATTIWNPHKWQSARHKCIRPLTLVPFKQTCRLRVTRCEIPKTVYVVWPSCPLSLPSRSPAPAPQVALLASNFQDWGVRLYLFWENITKWDVTLVKFEKLCCSFHRYMGCPSTLVRGFVRQATQIQTLLNSSIWVWGWSGDTHPLPHAWFYWRMDTTWGGWRGRKAHQYHTDSTL